MQAFDTIIQGLLSYYGHSDNGKWIAFALFWGNLVVSLCASFTLVLAQMTIQGERKLSDVTGMYLASVRKFKVSALINL